MFVILATNNIWKSRLVRVGVIDNELVPLFAASGVVARSAGFRKDLRLLKTTTYSYYWYLKFRSFLGRMGDCFDRFIIRIREMLESVFISYQVLSNLVDTFSESGNFSFWLNSERYVTNSLNLYQRSRKGTSMEALINHFKHYSEGVQVPAGVLYQSVEAPKGEFGTTIVSDGSARPFRCKIRTPAYHHLQFMSSQIRGHYFADMITILGSQDVVFGEVDR